VVNIGHLRRDTPPELLRQLDPGGYFVLLLRNPFDIAISRAFRKPQYRQQVAPDLSDDEYLARQVSGTYSFLSFADTQRWDRILRYEELRSNAPAILGDLVREMGLDYDAEAMEAVHALHDAKRIADQKASLPTTGNLNLDPAPELTGTQRSILESGLDSIAHRFGYAPRQTSDGP